MGVLVKSTTGTGALRLLALLIAAILIRQEYLQDITGVLPVESPDELQTSERGRKHDKEED